jgi:hypothetical protein
MMMKSRLILIASSVSALLVGIGIGVLISQDRRRIPGDIRAANDIVGDGSVTSYLENVGEYDVFQERDPDGQTSLWLVSADPRALMYVIPAGADDTPIRVDNQQYLFSWFARWSTAEGETTLWCAAPDRSGRPREVVVDRDGDGTFDKFKLADGTWLVRTEGGEWAPMAPQTGPATSQP